MKNLFVLFILLGWASSINAQTKTYTSGIVAKTIKAGKVKKTAKVGDMINTDIVGKFMGKTIFTTKTMNKGLPVNFKVEKPKYPGDVMEGIMKMNEGDSTIFYIPADTFYRGNKPAGYKASEKVVYTVKINWIKTQAEVAKEQKAYEEAVKKQKIEQAKFNKLIADQKKAQAKAAALIKKDRATLDKYTKDNNIANVQTTTSGLRYVITQKGEGPKATAGKQVTVNYTGKLLDGTPFDSNLDSAFGHVMPFSFPLGQGRVIKGWDEGIALLEKGAKATLYIPSDMAYGPAAQAKIPANSNLMFDVELVEIADVPPPPAPAPPPPPAPTAADVPQAIEVQSKETMQNTNAVKQEVVPQAPVENK